jgi:hypothetical protein
MAPRSSSAEESASKSGLLQWMPAENAEELAANSMI